MPPWAANSTASLPSKTSPPDLQGTKWGDFAPPASAKRVVDVFSLQRSSCSIGRKDEADCQFVSSSGVRKGLMFASEEPFLLPTTQEICYAGIALDRAVCLSRHWSGGCYRHGTGASAATNSHLEIAASRIRCRQEWAASGRVRRRSGCRRCLAVDCGTAGGAGGVDGCAWQTRCGGRADSGRTQNRCRSSKPNLDRRTLMRA